jgi:hypothetical protein
VKQLPFGGVDIPQPRTKQVFDLSHRGTSAPHLHIEIWQSRLIACGAIVAPGRLSIRIS